MDALNHEKTSIVRNLNVNPAKRNWIGGPELELGIYRTKLLQITYLFWKNVDKYTYYGKVSDYHVIAIIFLIESAFVKGVFAIYIDLPQ